MGDPDLEDLIRLFLQAEPPGQRELAFVSELLGYGHDRAVPENLRRNHRRKELETEIEKAEKHLQLCRAELARVK